MKKYFILLLTFIAFVNVLSQKLNFPDSFKFDRTIFNGMALLKITDEIRKEHILKNPAAITDKLGIKRLAKRMDSKDIKEVYYEIYSDNKGRGDAGVIVFKFNSEENLQKILPSLYPQSNYITLTVDNYLIKVWNDSNDTENRLRKSVDYYSKKVNAKEFNPTPNDDDAVDYVTASAEDATMETTDAVAEVAAAGSYYNIGFGSLSSNLISEDESKNLINYIQKFKDNYQIEVAIENIGISDLIEEMIPGYASHLVFNDDNRIANNILILIDELQDKSYFYFGTQNGKVLKKLPLERLKIELNQQIAQRKIYSGLDSVLKQFEIALIEASK